MVNKNFNTWFNAIVYYFQINSNKLYCLKEGIVSKPSPSKAELTESDIS